MSTIEQPQPITNKLQASRFRLPSASTVELVAEPDIGVVDEDVEAVAMELR